MITVFGSLATGRGWMEGDVGARDLGKSGSKKRGAILWSNFRPSSNRPLPALFSLLGLGLAPSPLNPNYLNFIVKSGVWLDLSVPFKLVQAGGKPGRE